MKVLLVNGSSNKNGCTFTALSEAAKSLNEEGIETEIFQIGNAALRDCCGCMGCRRPESEGKCVFKDDIVNDFIDKAKTADGFIFGSPVYYAHPSARLLALLDRAFYAGGSNFEFKPGAAVVSARRSGTTASFDVINKYFTINKMPVVSSTYWNNVHGGQNRADEVMQDIEGLNVMRTLGKNMAWLIKCIENGKNTGITQPELEPKPNTNFIR